MAGSWTCWVNRQKKTVAYVGSADQLLDFTTMRDVAAFTAPVAIDPRPTPKFLRIAGDVVCIKDVAEAVSLVEGGTFKPSWMGSLVFLRIVIWLSGLFGGEDKGIPCLTAESIFSGDGKLEPLDNDRYPEVKWTRVSEFLREDKEKSSHT
ncbi:uncharacterized protein BDV17DRAFT_289107 [Aspergillus undulatus]|uniref:uncharacterized protein n=1 Tax=Aspergillus undulatus TaxID=1810928 RepID=UPI003CCCAEA5